MRLSFVSNVIDFGTLTSHDCNFLKPNLETNFWVLDVEYLMALIEDDDSFL
jgi:hypothetical protein